MVSVSHVKQRQNRGYKITSVQFVCTHTKMDNLMQYQAPLIESESTLLCLVDYHIRSWSKDFLSSEHLKPALCFFDKLYPKLKSGHEYTTSVQFLVSHAEHLYGLLECSSTHLSPTPLYQHLSNNLNNELRGFIKQENENSQSLAVYLDSLQQHYARMLAVRVDLSYRRDFHELVNIDRFHEDISLLRSRISNKKGCFRHLHGYVWALEQGEDKGYHCHLLLLYDGSKRHKDCYLGQEVGEHWQILTGGYGQYYNCNDPNHLKPFKESGKCGIGMIHRKNEEQVRNLSNVAQYLTRSTKLNQRLLVKAPGMRTFGHGIFDTGKRRGINR